MYFHAICGWKLTIFKTCDNFCKFIYKEAVLLLGINRLRLPATNRGSLCVVYLFKHLLFIVFVLCGHARVGLKYGPGTHEGRTGYCAKLNWMRMFLDRIFSAKDVTIDNCKV